MPDESLWRRALRRECPPDRPRAVVPPAANTDYFDPTDSAPAEVDGGPLRILSVGPLVWAQGYEHALHAARVLLDQGIDFEYRIVGDGEHLPALTFARYQLGLEGKVELLSPDGPAALRSQLRWADVFLDAAVAEGFTEAVAEAHAMQLPVVASERGLLDESADGVLSLPGETRTRYRRSSRRSPPTQGCDGGWASGDAPGPPRRSTCAVSSPGSRSSTETPAPRRLAADPGPWSHAARDQCSSTASSTGGRCSRCGTGRSSGGAPSITSAFCSAVSGAPRVRSPRSSRPSFGACSTTRTHTCPSTEIASTPPAYSPLTS